jgi:hypothetical protein
MAGPFSKSQIITTRLQGLELHARSNSETLNNGGNTSA